VRGETAELGGLSGAVEAFEGDEISARHDCLQITAECGGEILPPSPYVDW
jgi:hypothetical protein